MKIIDVTLPEWAWINGSEHERGGDLLSHRNVILHVRSASVIEFFEDGNFMPAKDVPVYEFDYTNNAGGKERHIAALHYSTTLTDSDSIIELLHRAADWYKEYMTWEDRSIEEHEKAALN